MTESCGATTSRLPAVGKPLFARRASLILLSAFAAACSTQPEAASANAAAPAKALAMTDAPLPSAAPATAAADGTLRLSGAANGAAVSAALAEAKRQDMIDVEVTGAQSFRLMDGAQEVATLITGKGRMPGATYAGCFVAVKQAADVSLIPTLGDGEYEAETCGGPTAVGILSSGRPVRIGVMFQSLSSEAAATTPIIIRWNRADNTLLIDQALSSRALDSGSTTIEALRRLVP